MANVSLSCAGGMECVVPLLRQREGPCLYVADLYSCFLPSILTHGMLHAACALRQS